MCFTIRVGSFRQVCLFVWKRQGPIDRFIRFRRSWCRALINLLWSIVFSKFSVALRPQRPYGLLRTGSFFQCCFTSIETVRNIRDGEPRKATSTFAQPLSPGCFPQGWSAYIIVMDMFVVPFGHVWWHLSPELFCGIVIEIVTQLKIHLCGLELPALQQQQQIWTFRDSVRDDCHLSPTS